MFFILPWYVAFGALHEAAHLLAASGSGSYDEVFTAQNYLRAAFGRHVVIVPSSSGGEMTVTHNRYADEACTSVDNCFFFHPSLLVRHAGWMTSVALAILVLAVTTTPRSSPRHDDEKVKKRRKRRWWLEGVRTAAVVTALEAVQTDLLQQRVSLSSSSSILFCGNFGIILVNLAWATRGSRDALSILEKMIEVTMMRGAQSGGVVSYNDGGDPDAMRGDAPGGTRRGRGLSSVRVRVVNGKRTDLSKLVRDKLQRAVSRVRQSPRLHPFFAGHTRFGGRSRPSPSHHTTHTHFIYWHIFAFF